MNPIPHHKELKAFNRATRQHYAKANALTGHPEKAQQLLNSYIDHIERTSEYLGDRQGVHNIWMKKENRLP